jgi:hypothetical protein
MIQTKRDSTALTQTQLPVDKAIAEGKLYNPLTGKELLELIINRLRQLLQTRPSDIPPALAMQIEQTARKRFSSHSRLDTEVVCYPKADVAIGVYIRNRVESQKAQVSVIFNVYEHPKEENRGFGDNLILYSETEWDRDPLELQVKFNTDAIPPDATRILNDLPVPAPVKKPGSGPNGEATYVDVAKPASEKQREAVVKQFGSGKDNQPNQSNSKKEGRK